MCLRQASDPELNSTLVRKPSAFAEGLKLMGQVMKLPRRTFLHLAGGAAALPAVSRIAQAQAYPARPVHIVIGLPAGLSPDIVVRLVGQELSERLGQPVVIDNRSGAGGSIATELVVRARRMATCSF